jgi:hypothetical protein
MKTLNKRDLNSTTIPQHVDNYKIETSIFDEYVFIAYTFKSFKHMVKNHIEMSVKYDFLEKITFPDINVRSELRNGLQSNRN